MMKNPLIQILYKGISLTNMSDNFGTFLRVHRSPDNEESIAKNIS